MVHMLSDQYAFRQTGSTTAVLISIHQHVTAHLDVHVEPYVARPANIVKWKIGRIFFTQAKNSKK